jgi:hypothetical protein
MSENPPAVPENTGPVVLPKPPSRAYSIYRDPDLTDRQRDVLQQVQSATQALKRSLQEVEKDAERALARLAAGKLPRQATTLFGQYATQSEVEAQRLDDLMNAAVLYAGIPVGKVVQASQAAFERP